MSNTEKYVVKNTDKIKTMPIHNFGVKPKRYKSLKSKLFPALLLTMTIPLAISQADNNNIRDKNRESGLKFGNYHFKEPRKDFELFNKDIPKALSEISGEKAQGIFDKNGNIISINDKSETSNLSGPMAEQVVQYAMAAVHKIPYYYGGGRDWALGHHPGWVNNNFGSPHPRGGDARGRNKIGLDCSGFIMWVFNSLSIPHKWGSTENMNVDTTEVTKEDLKPGDIGLKVKPGAGSGGTSNHVGIYVGDGIWVHCGTNDPASPFTNGVTTVPSKFEYFYRPNIYSDKSVKIKVIP